MRKVIGIDLGTTYSAVAILDEVGKPKILQNQDGDSLTPSVVFFQSDDGKDEPLVGIQAKNLAATQPENVVQFVKRQMGDKNYRFDSLSDISYTAEEISAIILKRLKEGAENALGEKIEDAVITVPAYFDDSRRVATRKAGEMAGLNVLRVLNEPTAAALAYGVQSNSSETVLVYDLGGGTFDVTLMKISEGEFDVVGTDGDRNLGGFDFDNALSLLIAQKMEAMGAEGTLVDPKFAALLREKSESTKRALTTVESTNVFIDYQGKPYKIPISREEFERETLSLVNRTEEILDDVVEESGYTWNDIDRVLLIGGSTRMPMIKQALEKKLGKPIVYAINPDEAVAVGAAIQGGLEVAKSDEDLPDGISDLASKISISDVTSQSLGILTLDENEELFNSIIIKKNSKIPDKYSESFLTVVDNQKLVRVRVTQGESSNPDLVVVIGEAEIELPGNWPKGTKLNVTLHYDIDQTIFTELHDKDLNLLGQFEIKRDSVINEMDFMVAKEKITDMKIN